MITLRNALRNSFRYAFRKVGSSSRNEKDVSPAPAKTSRRANVFAAILSPIEAYVVSFQSLLIWERPYISAAAFVTVNCLYWLVVSWNRRLFSILSIGVLISFVYRTWINQIWPEIRVPPQEGEDTEEWTPVNPQVLSVPELSGYISNFFNKMMILWRDVWRLRKENHGLFCALSCAFLSLLALFGHFIPGVLIVYVLVLAMSLGPGIALHLVPSTLYDQLVGYFAESDTVTKAEGSGSNSDEDSYLEEFMPETSAEVIRQLSLRDDSLEVASTGRRILDDLSEDVENELRELGTESFTNDSVDELLLYQGLGAFPSVEEEPESDLDDISDNILPKMGPESGSAGMHFVPSHFKEESSSSESDAVFTKDLSFSGAHEDLLEGRELVKLASVSGSEKPGATDPSAPKVSSSTDDELMDFEILEESEVRS